MGIYAACNETSMLCRRFYTSVNGAVKELEKIKASIDGVEKLIHDPGKNDLSETLYNMFDIVGIVITPASISVEQYNASGSLQTVSSISSGSLNSTYGEISIVSSQESNGQRYTGYRMRSKGLYRLSMRLYYQFQMSNGTLLSPYDIYSKIIKDLSVSAGSAKEALFIWARITAPYLLHELVYRDEIPTGNTKPDGSTVIVGNRAGYCYLTNVLTYVNEYPYATLNDSLTASVTIGIKHSDFEDKVNKGEVWRNYCAFYYTPSTGSMNPYNETIYVFSDIRRTGSSGSYVYTSLGDCVMDFVYAAKDQNAAYVTSRYKGKYLPVTLSAGKYDLPVINEL